MTDTKSNKNTIMRISARTESKAPDQDPGPTRLARTGPPRRTPAPPGPSTTSGARQVPSTGLPRPGTRQGQSSGPPPPAPSQPGPPRAGKCIWFPSGGTLSHATYDLTFCPYHIAVSARPPERQVTPPKPPNPKRQDARPTPPRPGPSRPAPTRSLPLTGPSQVGPAVKSSGPLVSK